MLVVVIKACQSNFTGKKITTTYRNGVKIGEKVETFVEGKLIKSSESVINLYSYILYITSKTMTIHDNIENR